MDQRKGPPHNPGLRELVAGKRRHSPVQDADKVRGFRGWNERGYLPHRDEPGLVQFVTFRLKDSFPDSLRSEWEHLLSVEDDRERRVKMEEYLDRGRGECHLSRPEVAEVVEQGLRMFHGARYELRAWVVMPNHVHVLFKVMSVPMSVVIGGWKKHSGRRAHKLLGGSGAFWAEDYFDMYMRNAEHERKTIRYIESNPVRDGLVWEPKEWRWSSARFRDELGNLKFGSAGR